MNDDYINDVQPGGIPDGRSFAEKSYTINRPPMQSVPYQMNRPPVQSVPPQINRTPVQSVPPQMNRPPMQSVTPQMNRPPMQSVPPQMNRPPMQSITPQMYAPAAQPGMYNQPLPQYNMQPAYQGVSNGYRYYYQPSPEEIEKNKIKKSFTFSGTTTLVLLGGMYLVAMIIMVVGFCSGIVRNTPSTDDPYVGFTPIGFYAYEGLASLLGIFIPALILAKASKVPMNELFPFKKLDGKYLAALVVGGMSVCMIAQLAITILIENLYIFGIDIESALDQETATGLADIVLSTICTAIIPALVEEFAYRGVVLGVLKRHDETFAIFASAFLFGLLHGNFVQIPFAFIIGLVAAFVRVKSDSMLPSILIHFGNNFFAVIMTALPDLVSEEISSFIEAGVMFVFIIAGIFAINYLTKNHKEIFEQKKSNTKYSFGELNKIFFSRATVIVCLVLLTLSSLMIVSAVK